MAKNQFATPVSVRKPYVKMQIEKVNLRTDETMGDACNRLSSATAEAVSSPACAVTTVCMGTTG